MSNEKYVVKHPQLHLAVEGKLTHIKPGTNLTLGSKQGQKLAARGFVTPLDGESKDLTTGATDEAAEKLAALKARAAELNLEGSNRWGESRLIKEIQEAEDAIAAGNAAAGSSE